MIFNVHGDKIMITEPIELYIKEKIGRLDKYFSSPDILTAHVLVKIQGGTQVIEVTIPAKNIILRAEESNKDLYAAIDLVSEKLEGQIRKNKTKMHKHVSKERYADFNINYETEEFENKDLKIVKRKILELEPLTEEEAILQLELIGHDFFVFKNKDLEEICVLYKRKDNDYGLIITEED